MCVHAQVCAYVFSFKSIHTYLETKLVIVHVLVDAAAESSSTCPRPLTQEVKVASPQGVTLNRKWLRDNKSDISQGY